MSLGKKLLWGSFGWVLGGPIGGILGYAAASLYDNEARSGSYNSYFSGNETAYPKTKPGDFMVSMLVLLAAVMKADKQLLKSELDFVKQFLKNQFHTNDVHDFMVLFKDILNQEYHLRDVCRQVQRSMDHPSRLELVHVLFGLSQADGYIHPDEIKIIHTIARYMNINENDFISIQAMFVRDSKSDFKILEVSPDATDAEVKKAYRKMANKYHPDKVSHLGDEFQKLAEEKFKSVNDAYQAVKKQREI
ncbi:MAG: TerB family tellurite resistance protein [Candidatus Neomarinimicrobiota bacterium]|nr:TerB family tellurite resistance protein [Candidatus Neomarinimicrobiota bacterium]